MNLRKKINPAVAVVIMSPCHKATIAARIILRNPIILDAGWPLTDGILSRGQSWKWIFKLPYSYCLDFLSFQCASKVLLESKSQAERTSKMFFLKKSKVLVSFTGFDEVPRSELVSEGLIASLEYKIRNLQLPLTVLFRGKINNESGFKTILEASSYLRNTAYFIFVTGSKTNYTDAENVTFISEITSTEMSLIYGISDAAIGQISSHPRLKYTIPHKAFEAGYFGKPYLTVPTPGLLEIFPGSPWISIASPETEDLVAAINRLVNQITLKNSGSVIAESYKVNCSQSVINDNFYEIVMKVISHRK